MRRVARMGAFAGALLLVVGAAACGGSSDKVEPGAYAKSVCDAVGDWVTGIQERGESIGEGLQSGDAEGGKEALLTFLDDTISDTEKLMGRIDDAGVPDVDGGEEFADEIAAAFEDARDTLQDARDDAEDISTESPEEFAEQSSELGTSIQEALGAVGDSVSDPPADLDSAFQDEPSCQEIPG